MGGWKSRKLTLVDPWVAWNSTRNTIFLMLLMDRMYPFSIRKHSKKSKMSQYQPTSPRLLFCTASGFLSAVAKTSSCTSTTMTPVSKLKVSKAILDQYIACDFLPMVSCTLQDQRMEL